MNIQPIRSALPAEHLHHLVSLFRVLPIEFGTPATLTDLMARQSELRRLGCSLRELRQEAARLRNQRQSKAASICEDQLRAVINEILAMGRP